MNYHERLEEINKEIEDGCDVKRLKQLRKKLYAIPNGELDDDDWVLRGTIRICIREMLAEDREDKR